jgi:hypothetical protein
MTRVVWDRMMACLPPELWRTYERGEIAGFMVNYILEYNRKLREEQQ